MKNEGLDQHKELQSQDTHIWDKATSSKVKPILT